MKKWILAALLCAGCEPKFDPAFTNEVSIRVADPDAVQSLARRTGAREWEPIGALEGWFVLRYDTVRDAAKAVSLLQGDPAVAEAVHERSMPTVSCSDDPFFPLQIHLRNSGQQVIGTNGKPYKGTPGIDLNVESVWAAGWKGDGIRVAVMDDAFQVDHPDLAPNYDPVGSYGAGITASDTAGAHGTAVAGLVSGRGDNGIGISGVAPRSKWSALRRVGSTDALYATLLSHQRNGVVFDVHQNSWGTPYGVYLPRSRFAKSHQSIETGAIVGRGGRGTVYVFAAGNDSKYVGYHANTNPFLALPEVIVAGGIGLKGKTASFSFPGSNVLVCGISTDGNGYLVTTDRLGAKGYDDGDYAFDMGGTSGAAPQVSGVVALMLDANPNLSWRDVQHILVRSAVKTLDDGWTTNGAGFAFHYKCGFGFVQAEPAVKMAQSWTTVPARMQRVYGAAVGAAVPDGNATGVTRALNVPDSMRLEHVLVEVVSDHLLPSDYRITLTSPSGTESLLARPFPPTFSFAAYKPFSKGWTFKSVQFWGEQAKGSWTIRVADLTGNGTAGAWASWKITLLGTATEVTPLASQKPALLSAPAVLAIGQTVSFSGEGVSVVLGGVLQPVTGTKFTVSPQTPIGVKLPLILSSKKGTTTYYVSTALPQPPSIASIAPNPAVQNGSLTITGTNLKNCVVVVGGSYQSVTYRSATKLVISKLVSVPGTVEVKVGSADGIDSSTITVQPAP